MMTTPANDPYWTEDISLFEAAFRYTHNEPTIVRACIHVDEERYDFHAMPSLQAALVTKPQGMCSYLFMKLYLLEPNIILTIGRSPGETADGVVGTVRDATWDGMRHCEVGEARAWHYPADQVTVLWDCVLQRFVRDRPLTEDPTMLALWQSVEGYLLARFPATRQLATPQKDPLFDTQDYQRFLQELGYHPLAQEQALYGKQMEREPEQGEG